MTFEKFNIPSEPGRQQLRGAVSIQQDGRTLNVAGDLVGKVCPNARFVHLYFDRKSNMVALHLFSEKPDYLARLIRTHKTSTALRICWGSFSAYYGIRGGQIRIPATVKKVSDIDMIVFTVEIEEVRDESPS